MMTGLKPLELSDLVPELDLTANRMDDTVWHMLNEKPATLAVQDYGLESLVIATTDKGCRDDQSKAAAEFLLSIYHPGMVNEMPYYPIFN